MKLFLTDTETSGLKAYDSNVLEVAAILYSVEAKAVLQQWSTLLYAPSNPAEHVNKITQIMLDEVAMVDVQPEAYINMALEADVLIAYNADFDKPFIAKWINGIEINGKSFPKNKPWVCAYKQLHYPKPSVNKKLSVVAAAHGITLGGEHRALFDCQLMAQLFMQTPDLEEQIMKYLPVKE